VAGAGGKEVGRVSIRVVPDLDRFREQLKAELEKFEKETLKIKASVDTSGIRQQVSAATKNLPDAEVKVKTDSKELSGLSKQLKDSTEKVKPEVEPKIKLDAFQRRYINKIRAAIAEFEANIPLTVDGELIRRELDAEAKRAIKEIEKINFYDKDLDEQELADLRRDVDLFYDDIKRKGSESLLLNRDNAGAIKRAVKSLQDFIKVDVELDLQRKTFDKAVEEAKEQSEKIWSDLDAKLNIRVEDGEIIKIRKSLSERVVVPVDIQARFDRGGFTRAAAIAIAGSFKVAGAALGGVTKGLGVLQKAFSRFSAESVITGVAIVAAVAALAAPAIALLSGALLTLPAALAGILVPVGVIALGLDGIKKAAETAKPAFEELKKAVSDTFENGLKPGFELIRDRLIPGLTEPLKGVASSLSTAFNSVIGTLSSGSGLNNLQRTIDSIAEAIKTAAPGLQSFTSALTSLVANVSAKFPNLSESFNNVGKDFDNWIAKISSNGQLDTALDTLGGTLSEIGGTIKDIAQWGFDNLADPNFGNQLKGFATDLRGLVNDVLPLLKSGFQDIATVVSGIRDTVDAIKAAASTFEKFTFGDGPITQDRLNEQRKLWGNWSKFGIDDDANIVKWLGLQRGGVAKESAALGQEAAQKFQESMANAAVSGDNGAGLTDAINRQLTSALDVSKELQAEALRSTFTGMGVTDAVGTQIATQIGAVIAKTQESVRNLGPALQADIDAALMPLNQIPQKVIPSLAALGAAFGGAWAAIGNIVRQSADEIGNSIALSFQQIPAKLNAAWAGLGASIGGALGAVKGVVTSSMAGITDAFGQAFAGVAGRVASALSGVPAAVGAAITPAIGVVQAVMTGIINLVSIAGSQIAGVASATFAQFPPAVQGAMSPAIAAVGSVGQQMISTMLAFAGAAESAGRAIGASFAAGIASSADLVAGAASALMGAARAFFPNSPADKGPFSGSGWVDKSGEAIGQGFSAGIESSVGGVVDIARVMMQQVKDVFGDASGVVFNFNFNEVAQPISQFSNSIAGIGTSMAGALPAAQEFQQTLGQTGQSLAMLDSSQSKGRIEELKKSLLELEIQRKQLEAARDMPGADQAAIKAQIEQIRNQKNLLGLERDKLTYAQKYGGQMSSTAQSYKEQMNSLQQIPFDFATATSNQFMSDLGWSGQGAIPSLMQQGMDFGTNFIFNVANMDDALSGQRVLQNRTAQATLGR
jgi:phage-related protein